MGDWVTPTLVTLGEQAFTGGIGDWWVVAEGLEGWYDSPDVRSESRPRSQADGSFDNAVQYLDEREIVLTARHAASSQLEAQAQVMAWASALAKRTDLVLTVEDAAGAKSARVKVRGRVRVRQLMADLVEFMVTMVAADPRKYGAPVVTQTGLPTAGTGLVYPIEYPIDWGMTGDPGRLVTANSGTAETFSRFDITGGLSGGFELTCVEAGRVIRFERPVPLGSTITLNPRTGRASIDGQSDVSGSLTRREWWSVPPGGVCTVQFTALGVVTGTPLLTASTSPGFW